MFATIVVLLCIGQETTPIQIVKINIMNIKISWIADFIVVFFW